MANYYISGGKTSTGITLNSGDSMHVSNATVNNTTLNGGWLNVSYGGIANNTIVKYNGFMNVFYGGRANSTHVYGYMNISNGAVAGNTIVYPNGHVNLFGTASNVIVNSQGFLNVNAGGVAKNIGVYDSAGIYVNGTAYNISLNRGGHMSIYGTANDIDVNTNGSVYIASNGKANSTTIDYGDMYIDSRGLASYTVVNSRGSMRIGGGSAVNTIINKSGFVRIFSGSMTNTSVNYGGRMDVSSGGVASDTEVNSGGMLNVKYGGSAVNIKENGGFVDVSYLPNATFVSNTVTGMTLQGSMTVHSNTTADSTVISMGSMCIYGGVANNTVVRDGAVYVHSGGVANDTDMSGGELYVHSGGTVNGVLVNPGCNLYISSGGTALAVKENGCFISVAEGANVTFASNTVSGMILKNTSMTVHSNTIAEGISVEAGGRMIIYSGGVGSEIKENGGYVYVEEGADVIFASNTISGIAISSAMSVHSNTVASGVTVNGMGLPMYVYSGGIVNNTVVNGWGYVYLFSGGFANENDIKRGLLRVSSGGVASETHLDSDGYIWIYSGGVHRGGLQIAQSGTVSAYTGSIIDFTVADRTVEDDYLINDLSLIIGDPQYTITVSEYQKAGTYKLARGAADFEKTLTISDDTVSYGSITVNGDDFEYNRKIYSLDESDGDLTLTIVNKDAPITNLLSNGVSQILAWDAEQGKVGYMATDGNVRPAWRGVWEWSGAEADLWRVAGVGHFKGSEVDYDGVLLYNGVGNRFAAWTDLRKGSYGYVNLCKVDGSFNTQCLANLDGDQYDDILIYDTNGSIGVVLGGTTYKDIFHVNEGDFATWTIEGAGSFDDGMDKLVMVNNYNHQVYLWTNQDTTFATWNWKTQSVGKLESGWEVAAVGDFEGDGIDDIMVLDRNTNNVWVWDDGNSQTKRWRGTLGEGFEIEASGDYNGDGSADLLLREYNSGWGGMGYWGNGYAGNWVDLKARIETDLKSSFDIIA